MSNTIQRLLNMAADLESRAESARARRASRMVSRAELDFMAAEHEANAKALRDVAAMATAQCLVCSGCPQCPVK